MQTNTLLITPQDDPGRPSLNQLFRDSLQQRTSYLHPSAPYEEFRSNPVGFAKDILKVTLEDYQARKLNALCDPERNAVAEVSGNGPGKSFSDAVAALWFMNVHPLSIVLEIEPTEDQIKRNFIAEISKLLRNADDKLQHLELAALQVFHKKYKQEWFIAGRISNNPENVKSARSKYMMIIFGEAQGIGRDIISAARTRLTASEPGSVCKRIMTGNPGYIRDGAFFDIMTKDGFDTIWHRYHISCLDSPRVSNEFIKEVELEYGKDSPEYAVMVLGQWPNTSLSNLCTDTQYQAAIKLIKPLVAGTDDMGLDIARNGSNRTVLTHVNNGTVIQQWKWTHFDTMETATACAQHIDEVHPQNMYIDDTGVGGGVTDRLLQLNYNMIQPINFGSAAYQPIRFQNIKAEMLHNVSRLLEEGELSLIHVAKDRELEYQLTHTYKDHERQGKQRIRYVDAHAGKATKSCDELHSLALALLNTLPSADHVQPIIVEGAPLVMTRKPLLNSNFGQALHLHSRMLH